MNQIYVCKCSNGPKVDNLKLSKLEQKLNSLNIAYTTVNDYCGICSDKSQSQLNFTKQNKNIIFGCKPKALNNLTQRSNLENINNSFEYFEINETAIEEFNFNDCEKGELKQLNFKTDWKPWYPAIDYELCTSCQKCLNFCLFGVYELNNDGKVIVENPEKCKDLCPACARTCPTNAIVFPKHHESPIDGGNTEFVLSGGSILDEVQQSQDVYALLAKRRKQSGISLLKADQEKLAKEEREKYKPRKS